MAIPFTSDLIQELSQKTGADIDEIKEALQESGGDTDAAVSWLREHGFGEEDVKISLADYGIKVINLKAGVVEISDPVRTEEIDEDLVAAGSIKVPDVKSLRTEMNLSQSAFAERFGLSLNALQNWEQRRRTPDKSARILIRLIAANPDLVAEVAAEEA